MQEAGPLPSRHQRLPSRLDPRGLDLPRACGWYPGGYPGRAGEGTEASRSASELPARNTQIRGSRTIKHFFFSTETASCSLQKPPVGRSRPRDLHPPPPAPPPFCWGCNSPEEPGSRAAGALSGVLPASCLPSCLPTSSPGRCPAWAELFFCYLYSDVTNLCKTVSTPCCFHFQEAELLEE